MVFVPLNKKHIAALFWSIKFDYKACLTMELMCKPAVFSSSVITEAQGIILIFNTVLI